MRNNFIEELFYGNISPHNQSISTDKNFKKVWEKLSVSEDMLTQRLSGDDNKLFREYVDTYGQAFTMNEVSSFIRGFRIGARLIFDTFDNVDELMFI